MCGTEEACSRSPFLLELLRILFYVLHNTPKISLFYILDLLYPIRILFVDYFSVNFRRLLYGFFSCYHEGCFLMFLLNV